MAERSKRERSREAARDAVAQAGAISHKRETADTPAPRVRQGGDPFSAEMRRRRVLPLLVFHLIAQGPSYGNQLMERIGELTEGVLSVNPNTMYPLLRKLEEDGMIEGQWEHPERRTRRFYSLTRKGRSEYRDLLEEVRPFLENVASSVNEIIGEVYD